MKRQESNRSAIQMQIKFENFKGASTKEHLRNFLWATNFFQLKAVDGMPLVEKRKKIRIRRGMSFLNRYLRQQEQKYGDSDNPPTRG